MAVSTSRTKEKASIRFEKEKCTLCGLCVSVCKDFSLIIEDNELTVSENPAFGCIGCGHCMAICPSGAIKISGREISEEDLFDLPEVKDAANYDQLMHLFNRRRSIREFSDRELEPELIQKIIDAAKFSPMGLPPSDVNVLVFDSKEKNRQFAKDFCSYLESLKWFVSPWFIALMRPFLGKSNHEVLHNFIKPVFHIYTENMKQGVNYVNYDAPMAMYFYASPYADPADPIIAATAAMYAGESLGLGTCMLGAIHPLIQYGKGGRKFREKYSIRYPSREGLFVIFGYPSVKYSKGIRRSFASVTHL